MTDAKVMAAWAQVLAQPKVAALRLTPAEWEAAESIFEAGYRAGAASLRSDSEPAPTGG